MTEQTKKSAKKKYFDNVSVGGRTKQVVYMVEKHDKTAMLGEYIKNNKTQKAVIITNTKRSADELSLYLKNHDIKALAIHGNHRVEQIKEASRAFNSFEIDIIISTDMILKSLELDNIQVIINYDLPIQLQEYFVRLAHVDEVGKSISFVSQDEEKTLYGIELMMKLEIQQHQIENFEHTILSQDKKPQKDKKNKPRHRKQKQKTQDKSKEK